MHKILFQDSYERVFRLLRQELDTRFGSIGAVQGGFVHFDFEAAAMNGFSEVFPEVLVKGCLFHFAKAVQRKLDDGKLSYFMHAIYRSGCNLQV